MSSEEIDDRRKGEEQRRCEQEERDCEDGAQRDIAAVPAVRQQSPCEYPDNDGHGGNSGERAGGSIEDKMAGERLGCVTCDGEGTERETADACGKNGGGSEAVGECAVEFVRWWFAQGQAP